MRQYFYFFWAALVAAINIWHMNGDIARAATRPGAPRYTVACCAPCCKSLGNKILVNQRLNTNT